MNDWDSTGDIIEDAAAPPQPTGIATDIDEDNADEDSPRPLLSYKPEEIEMAYRVGAIPPETVKTYLSLKDYETNDLYGMQKENVEHLYSAGVITKPQVQAYIENLNGSATHALKEFGRGAIYAAAKGSEGLINLPIDIINYLGSLGVTRSIEDYSPDQEAVGDATPAPGIPHIPIDVKYFNPPTSILGNLTQGLGEVAYALSLTRGKGGIAAAEKLAQLTAKAPGLAKAADVIATKFPKLTEMLTTGAVKKVLSSAAKGAAGSVDVSLLMRPEAGNIFDFPFMQGLHDTPVMGDVYDFLKSDPEDPAAVARLKNTFVNTLGGAVAQPFVDAVIDVARYGWKAAGYSATEWRKYILSNRPKIINPETGEEIHQFVGDTVKQAREAAGLNSASAEAWGMSREQFKQKAMFSGSGESKWSDFFIEDADVAKRYATEHPDGTIRVFNVDDIVADEIKNGTAPADALQAMRSEAPEYGYSHWKLKEKRSLGSLPPEASADPHRYFVEKAIKEGKKVPPNVLKDYPDLQAEATTGQAVTHPDVVNPRLAVFTDNDVSFAPDTPASKQAFQERAANFSKRIADSTSAEVGEMLRQELKDADEALVARRGGVLKDAAVDAKAEEHMNFLAESMGYDPKKMMNVIENFAKEMSLRTKDLPVLTRTLALGWKRASEWTWHNTNRLLATGNSDDTLQAYFEYTRHANVAVDIFDVRASQGRSVRSWRSFHERPSDFKWEKFAPEEAKNAKVDLAKWREDMLEKLKDVKTAEDFCNLSRQVEKYTWSRGFREYIQGNSLLAPSTHVINVESAAANFVASQVIKTAVLGVKAPFSAEAREMLKSTVRGPLLGLEEALRLPVPDFIKKGSSEKIGTAWYTLLTGESVSSNPNFAQGALPVGAAQKTTAAKMFDNLLLKVPKEAAFRVLSAGDELISQVSSTAQKDFLLTQRALELGLSGKDVGEFVKRGFKNLPADISQQIELFSQQVGYKEAVQQGTIGHHFVKIFSSDKGPAGVLAALVPYPRMMVNIFSDTLQWNPLTAGVSARWRREVAAGGWRRTLALGKTAIGTSLMAWSLFQMDADLLTGITSPAEQAAGKPSFSIRADANSPWVSYAYFPQLMATFGFVSTIRSISQRLQWNHAMEADEKQYEMDSALLMSMQAFSAPLIEQPMAGTVRDAYKLFEASVKGEPGGAAKVAAKKLQMLIPGQSFFSYFQNVTDKHVRLFQDATDAVNAVFGHEHMLEARNVFTGEPAEQLARKHGALLQRKGVFEDDVVLNTTMQLNMSMPPMERKITVGGMPYELNRDEYRQLQAIYGSLNARGILTDVINTPGFQSLKQAPEEQRKIIRGKVTELRGAAVGKFLEAHKEKVTEALQVSGLKKAIRVGGQQPPATNNLNELKEFYEKVK
jgi:hypothetical protein